MRYSVLHSSLSKASRGRVSYNVFIILVITVVVSFLQCCKSSYIDLYMLNHRLKTHRNVSLGLQPKFDFGDHCPSSPTVEKSKLSYSPNRLLQKDTLEDGKKGNLQLAFILALGGHSTGIYDYGTYGSLNGLMSIWDSWVSNFFSVVSNTTSLVLLLDERDFIRFNFTSSKDEYLDTILIKNMGAKPVDCLHYKKKGNDVTSSQSSSDIFLSDKHRGNYDAKHIEKLKIKHPCSNYLPLDQGYKVYFVDNWNNPNASKYQEPFIIYASVHKFPKPDWAKNKDEEELYANWRPGRLGRFKTTYGYTKLTNWYSHHMTNLNILDFFDYGGKLDNDVSFMRDFPEPNIPYRLAQKNTKVLCTQEKWYFDSERISQGIRECLWSYIGEEAGYCKKSRSAHKNFDLQPAGDLQSIWWEHPSMNATFRAHFLVFWLGLYTAPEVRTLSKYWNDWWKGMWEYRWGDQQWWPRPMSMFSDLDVNLDVERYSTIDTDNEKYVVHKEWPRFGTINKTPYFQVNGTTREKRDELFKEGAKTVSKWRPF